MSTSLPSPNCTVGIVTNYARRFKPTVFTRLDIGLLLLSLLLLAACQPIRPPADQSSAQMPDTPSANAPSSGAQSAGAPVEGMDSPRVQEALALVEEGRGQANSLTQVAQRLQIGPNEEGQGRFNRGRLGPNQLFPRPAEQPVQEALANSFLQLFPELRQAAAPSWLRTGIRTTYYVQSATFSPNPDDPDPAGAGYLQYDLVALDRANAVSQAKLYLADIGSGRVQPSSIMPSWGLPGVGDYWIHPDALARAEEVATPDLAVVRMPATVGERTMNAVRFQYEGDQSTYVWMFEEETGLLVFHSYSIGAPQENDGQAGQIQLVAQRSLDLPWQAQARPAWATTGRQLRYSGTYATLIPGSPQIAMPYGAVAQVKRTGRLWGEYSLADSLYGQLNSSTVRVSGAAQLFDGLWLPVRAMANLATGQLLDEDPVTGARTVVGHASTVEITLSEVNEAYRIDLTYRARDGMLVAVHREEQVGIARNTIDLALDE